MYQNLNVDYTSDTSNIWLFNLVHINTHCTNYQPLLATDEQKTKKNDETKIHCTSTPPTHPLPHSSSSGRGYLEVSKKTPSHWIFEKYFQPYRILNHNGHIKEALDCIIYSLQLKNKFSEKIMQIKNKIEQGSYTLTLPLCFAFPSLRGK